MADLNGDPARFALLDHIPLGVCVLDRDLGVRFWNICLAGWTGIDRSEILGRDLSELFPHLREPRYYLRLRGIFEGGPPTIFSSQLHPHLIPAELPDGRLRIQHTVVTPIPATAGRPSADRYSAGSGEFDALLSIQDVTDLTRRLEDQKRAEEERRRMEAQVQHAQKLESLGVLAGGIAHDFNNLLVGILGNADLAQRRAAGDFAGREQLRAIVKSARRAADLANQMLAYSGRGAFVTQALDLSEAVDDAVELLKAAISKKASLECRLEKGLPAIEADPTQIRQVTMNLVTNASDALEGGNGRITITTGTRECSRAWLKESYLKEDLAPGRYVYLEVRDSGSGMDEDTLARIFDPFFTTRFAGRGLGLAMVLGIVRGHRGAMKITSETDTGTTFQVLFPSSEKPAEPLTAPADDGGDAWSASDTVLVVDDEEMVRGLAEAVLQDAGLEVLTAADGEEGLETFRRHADEISVVLLDMTMPKLNGEETLAELRKLSPEVRVVLTSGYTEQDADRHVSGSPRIGFIQKPYLPADLIAKVREALLD